MFRRMHHKKVTEGVIFLLFVFVIAVFASLQANRQQVTPVTYGATFSSAYAESLGLNWRDAYVDTLNTLPLKRLRIPIYWSDLQPTVETFNWEELDWMVDQAEAREISLVLVVGRKVPRWPECYVPDWAEHISADEQGQRVLEEIEAIVRRYDHRQIVERYQIENEPFYYFGDCPVPNAKLFDDEVALVRRLSDKPIQLTTSGENEFWIDVALPADILGVSLYRVTWDKIIGYSVYPVSADYYATKAAAVTSLADDVVVSELQAEPWLTMPIEQQTPAELAPQFTAEELLANVDFAKAAGFTEVNFWGIEYWYWMRQQGYPELWDAGRAIMEDTLNKR